VGAGDERGKRRWGARLTALLVLVVLAAGLAAVVQDRVHDRRRADAAAAARRVPAVTAAPAPLEHADDPAAADPASSTPPPPIPDPATLAALLDGPWSAPELGPRVVGVVVDADSGQVLADRGAGTPAIPASTTKLLTAAAALGSLPPTATFATRVVAGAAPGQIVLVGGGDPTLSGAPAGQPQLYPGAARLSDLAAALAAGAMTGPITSIVVDSSYFEGPTTGPGWDPADAPSTFAAPIVATMIDGGRDAPATGGGEAALRSGAPDLAAGRALAAMLGVPADAVVAGAAPAGAAVLAEVRSAPLIDLVQQMLSDSDNVLAEVIARQVAVALGQPASFAGAVAAIAAALGALQLPGLDPASYLLVDGSGLSPQNRIAPSALAAVLRAALSGAGPAGAGPAEPAGRALAPIIGGLPVAAWDGSLRERYQPQGAPDGTLPATPAAIAAQGVVRAKTGTLTGVSALAGVVRDLDGRALVFVAMADAVPDPAPQQAERALDAIAGTIAACGCR